MRGGERRGAAGTSRDSARKRDEGSPPLFFLSLTASQKLNNEKIKGSSVYKRVFQSRKHYFSNSSLLEHLISAVPPTLKILHRKSKKSIFWSFKLCPFWVAACWDPTSLSPSRPGCHSPVMLMCCPHRSHLGATSHINPLFWYRNGMLRSPLICPPVALKCQLMMLASFPHYGVTTVVLYCYVFLLISHSA